MSADPEVSEGRFTIEETEYLRVGGESLVARLYRPEGQGPFPAVLDVHGGAWIRGDRMNDVAIAEDLARHGVLVASIEFRMAPRSQYPEPIADIAFAIHWLVDQAENLNIDPEALFGLACSSGAHQLMLAVMRPNDPRYQAHLGGDSSEQPALRRVALCWPLFSPVARYEMVQSTGNQPLIDAHHAFWPDAETMAEGDPQLILERGEPAVTPALLILQGTVDENLTPDMADRFAAEYTARGGAVTLHKFEGEPHNFINMDPTTANAEAAIALITDFITAD